MSKEELDRLKVLTLEEIKRCTQLALASLCPGPPPETDGEGMDKHVQFLKEVFLQAVKENMTIEELGLFLDRLGLPSNDMIEVSKDSYPTVKGHLQQVLLSFPYERMFSNLDWRLETEVCRSHIMNEYKTYLIMKFTFTDGHSEMVKVTPATLFRLKDVMEEALNESKSATCQHVLRKLR